MIGPVDGERPGQTLPISAGTGLGDDWIIGPTDGAGTILRVAPAYINESDLR